MDDSIAGMSMEEIASLRGISRPLMKEELLHLARLTGAFWQYDYKAAEEGRVGMHARLKSGRHSDGFFASGLLLANRVILQLIADQIARVIFQNIGATKLSRITGVPKGASELGNAILRSLGMDPSCKMELHKLNGAVVRHDSKHVYGLDVVVEDFVTTGGGFREAVLAATQKVPQTSIAPICPTIINRGALVSVAVGGLGNFQVLPLANIRIKDWESSACPLCRIGSQAIKPKASEENWERIVASQFVT